MKTSNIFKNLRKYFYLLLVLFMASLQAQNPFITEIYTADPTARVFNNRLYVYPSHDVDTCQDGQGDSGFCMPDYHIFSTEDLVNWTDHGVSLDQNSIPWVENNSFGMWAPDCNVKNGTYYYYFPGNPADDSAFRKIGVATSNNPLGPFVPEPNYIQGVSGIDPGILVDDDGKGYMYYAQGGVLKAFSLTANMKAKDGGITTFNNFPAGYKEGPFPLKRNGIYYLTFAHIVAGKGYEVVYATGNNPKGPFTYRGTIMPNIGNGTNHHSIVEFKGKWYLFYHNWTLSGNSKLRSIRADEIVFNADGSIQQKTATLRGIGIPKAGDVIQIDRHSGIQNAQVHVINQSSEPRGFQVDFIKNNGWVKYDNVNFGTTTLKSISARVATPFSGGKLEIRTGSATGQLLATINVPNTGGWNTWQTVTANFTTSTTGIKNMVCVFKGSTNYLYNLNWVKFDTQNGGGLPDNPPPVTDNDIPFGKTVFIKGANDLYVSARKNETNVPLTSTSINKLQWEQFKVVDAGNGEVAFQAMANNNYISARVDESGIPIQAITTGNHGDLEHFEWRSLGNNKFALKADNNRWVSARLNESGIPLKANRNGAPLAWETFTFEEVNASKTIFNKTKSSLTISPNPVSDIVTVSGLGKGDKIVVYDLLGKKVIEIATNNNDAYFSVKNLDSGTYIVSILGKMKHQLIVE